MSRSFFLLAPTGESWEVADPIQWCLENAHEPILEHGRERLLTLTAADRQRIVRLVVRRCRLNLIEIQRERVIVHHWGQQGRGDLRSFFRKHSLAKQGVEVFLIDRKREVIAVRPGDDFLFGKRLPQGFPLGLYRQKWQRRGQEEPDDGTAAPGSWSSFVWEGVEPGLIPWAVLKAAWRTENPPPCPNCDRPATLAGFGRALCGMFNWRPRFVRFCPVCRRQSEDASPPNLDSWVLAYLDKRTLPGFQRVWGRVVKWQPPGDQGKGRVVREGGCAARSRTPPPRPI
jgi:hypothetical protein